jgi:L-seryl-tRNA(Ser) seleniumtransferase
VSGDRRRTLPSIEQLLREPDIAALCATVPRPIVADAAREAVARARIGRAGPPDDWADEIATLVARRLQPSLRPVVNATGIVLHTNLGRAPLAAAATDALRAVAGGYATLEFDLAAGTRGSRTDHGRATLAHLTGAADALVVNNAAGALVLALNACAAGRDVLISRGELIEIGGSFRIPDILAKSGARLREVGTTNRTHLADYRDGLDDGVGAILTVHRSNFAQVGFVTTPEPAALAALARERGVPYLHDVGSGLLANLEPWGLRGEPGVSAAVAAGAGLVLFSGDKLLGGPQAGCLVGDADLVDRCRRNALARALRADKLTLAALEATLALYLDPERARREIPVLRMLTADADDLASRAATLAAALPARFAPTLRPGESAVGGGAFPDATLPTTLVALHPGETGAHGLALRLRLGDVPVITRVEGGQVLLDPRTLLDDDAPRVVDALRAVAAVLEREALD